MSSAAARYPNPMQLPGLNLTRAKQREFHGQMLTLQNAHGTRAGQVPTRVLETLDEEPSRACLNDDGEPRGPKDDLVSL